MNELLLAPLFTVEEENLICIFDTSKRAVLIDSISTAIPGLDEPEIAEIAESALRKLNAMTDTGFAQLAFHPAYHGDGEGAEGDDVVIVDATEV